MPRRKSNMQGFDYTTNIIAIIVIIIMGLVLFGSCSAFLFSDTSSDKAHNRYDSIYSDNSYNETNSYGSNSTSNTIENKINANNVVNNTINTVTTNKTEEQSNTSSSTSYKTDTFSSSSSNSSNISAYENSQKQNTAKSTSASSSKSTETSSSSYSGGYVLNTNTKKFHYSSCSSVKQMKDKNKRYSSESREEIISQGYSPCQRCNP